jgi:hypothetical protein
MLLDKLFSFALSRNRGHPLSIYISEVIFSQQMFEDKEGLCCFFGGKKACFVGATIHHSF